MIIGTTSAYGTKITGVSKHLIERAITRGVTAKDIVNALTKPLTKLLGGIFIFNN